MDLMNAATGWQPNKKTTTQKNNLTGIQAHLWGRLAKLELSLAQLKPSLCFILPNPKAKLKSKSKIMTKNAEWFYFGHLFKGGTSSAFY